MAKIYIKINGLGTYVGIGRKKYLEEVKEKMEKDKEKIRKYRIEEIIVK